MTTLQTLQQRKLCIIVFSFWTDLLCGCHNKQQLSRYYCLYEAIQITKMSQLAIYDVKWRMLLQLQTMQQKLKYYLRQSQTSM